jgi:flagellar hook protein FlgE
MGGYSIALSGLVAQSEALNIVSNNLANLNTTGYKDSSASFQELVTQAMTSSSPNGAGVSSVMADPNFTQGSIQVTSGAYDAAIEGSGFFVVQNSQGQQMYTRAGDFSVNSSGSLVDANGDLVLGWTATNGTVSASGAPSAITIPAGAVIPPTPTTQFSVDTNLNAAATPTDAAGTFSTQVQVVDSLGETHDLTVTFTNTASNAWSYAVTVPGADLTGGTAGTPSSLTTGTLAFNTSGQLTSPASGSSGSVAVALTGLADGAADLNMNWNLYNPDNSPTLTQYAQTSAVSALNVDGTAAAQLTSVALADGGTLVAQYSNGQSQTVGQIALANIPNPDSLLNVGQNNFALGGTSGTPTIGGAGTGGLGDIKAGALEASNVDIATEFTRLMTYQQSYEANSRAITTIDQMQQDLMQMKA